MKTKLGLALVMLAMVAVSRLWVLHPLGFSPLHAVAFCWGAMQFRMRFLFLPLAMLDSYAMAQGGQVLGEFVRAVAPSYIGLFIIGMVGFETLKASVLVRLGSLLLSSMGFYFFTNVVCWLINPLYASGLGGLAQALTIGIAGFPPSFIFFRSTLAGAAAFFVVTELLSWNLCRSRVCGEKECSCGAS